jgi:DNA-binding NarL/FixJ family response regulator
MKTVDPASDPERAVTAVVADPHRATVGAIADLVGHEPGFSVVGSAVDRAHLARLLTRHHPDVLVLDPGILPGSGLSQLSFLLQASPSTRVLVVGMGRSEAWSREASRHGATYLPKDSPLADWLEAINAAGRPVAQAV